MGRREALVERGVEIDALHRAVAEAAAGDASCVLLEGPAGIGKTRLVAEARDRAERAGLRIVSARGGVYERDIPFGIARQLFERLVVDSGLDRDRDGDGPVASVVRVARIFDGAPDAGPASAEAALHEHLNAMYWLCVDLAEPSGLLLAVDDAQWADALSLRLLSYLTRRIEGLGICVVVAARTDEPGEDHQRLLGELATDPHTVLLRPAALTADAVGELLDRRFTACEAALPEACLSATGGNPFLLNELLDALQAEGGGPSAAIVATLAPTEVTRSILLRLSRLSSAARDLAVAASVLDDGTQLSVAAELAGLSHDAARPAADALVRAAILADATPLRFEHPIVRAAIAEDATPARRAAMHRRAAEVLAGLGAPTARIAAHLRRAEPTGEGWVVDTLRDAATGATRSGDPATAARLLTRALEEPAGDQEVAVLAALGAAQFHSARERDGAATLRLALDRLDDPGARVELRMLRTYALLSSAGGDEALRELQLALADARAHDPDVAVGVEMDMVGHAWMSPVASPTAMALLAPHADLAGDTPAQRLALAFVAAARVADPAASAAEIHHLALRAWGDGRLLEEVSTMSMAYYALLCALLAVESDHVAVVVSAGMAQCRERGTSFGVGGLHGCLALLQCERGSLRDAEASALSCREHAVPSFSGVAASWAALARLERGDVAGARAAFDDHGRPPGAPEPVWFFGPYVRARLALAEGRPQEAVDDLTAIGERVRGAAGFAACLPWRPHLAFAEHAAGMETAARRTAGVAVEEARHRGAPGRLGLALRAQARVGPRGDRVEVLREAVAVLEGTPAVVQLAQASTDLGIALLRAGERRAGRAELDRGLELAVDIGATGVARSAHEELRLAGARPRRPEVDGRDGLTAAEHRVARMAAEGRSNREIAEALVVTPKTVENQLGAVYRKLGVRSRRALPQALAADADADAAVV